MPSAAFPPDDETLNGYLLGTLPPEGVEKVREWLDEDPGRVERLARLSDRARDPLTEAISQTSREILIAANTIERVVRRVSDSLRTASGAGDTYDFSEHGETMKRDSQHTTSESPVWPPVRMGDYRTVKEIGRGGMGIVLEMSDERLGRKVAVKVLNPRLAKKPDATSRFMREARHAATVEHDNVVPILHVGEEASMFFIVMPLLRGESLMDRLSRREPMSSDEVVRIGKDIAAGLAAAHAKGVIHRDMKPANVWLDEETGRARILDFGLARLEDGADALTESNALVGTPAYMSPEQIDGKQATPRSDLFALGAILYECSAGKKAFDGPSITAILNAVGHHEPAPVAEMNPRIPAALSALIASLLAKNPSERPASAADVVAALANGSFLPPSGDYSTKVWVDRNGTSKFKRRRSFAVAVALGSLLLVSVGIWLGTRKPNDDMAFGEVASRGDQTDNRTPKEASSAADAEFKGRSKSATQKLVIPEVSVTLSKTPTRFTGKLDVKIERPYDKNKARLLRLDDSDALPLKNEDPFRIEGEVDPPAYLYVIWVDPQHDITPIYPWNPTAKDPWATRPAKADEKLIGKISLPPDVSKRYTATEAKPGVATMVLFANPEPLDISNEDMKKWFESLPDLPLPAGGNKAAVWFDDYVEVHDPLRRRTFGVVDSNDAFARWQGQLQKHFQGKAAFQTAVSFARTGN